MPTHRTEQGVLDHDSLRVLLAVAKTLNFTRAAAELGMSQPSVSQHIRRIEDELGRRLFRRTGLGVELTAEGISACAYARRIVGLVADLRGEMAGSGTQDAVRIGMAEDFCRIALAEASRLFARYCPSNPVHVVSGTYETLAVAMVSGSVDVAVMTRTGKLGEPEAFWCEPMQWFGSASLQCPLADSIPLVLPTSPNPLRDMILKTLHATGRRWRVAFEGASFAAVEAAMEAGMGVSLAPASMHFQKLTALGQAACLPTPPSIEFIMIGPAANASEATRTFVMILRKMAEFDRQRSRPAIAALGR